MRSLFRSSGRIAANTEPTKATWTINRLVVEVHRSLVHKRSMPLKNSLPEAFSALILVFSNQDGEYLWLPLLLSRALSAV